MEYNEIKQDLFMVSEEYFLAHCISSDAKMGAGIAIQFRNRFDLSSLQKNGREGKLKVGSCVKIGRVFNLITKEKYWHKPTYQTFAASVKNMKHLALKHNVKKIVMPKIGAGLDKLNWENNREIIKKIFEDTDIEILVCKF